MSSRDERIAIVLGEFDFEKVATVMRSVGWAWANSEGSPEVGELVRRAYSLLRAVEPGQQISGGGFRAVASHDQLSLAFELETAEYDEETNV